MTAEAAHRDDAIVLTRFIAIVAQFGRFLPRLGPFGFRTAFLYWQLLPAAVEAAEAQNLLQSLGPHFRPCRSAEIAFDGDALHL